MVFKHINLIVDSGYEPLKTDDDLFFFQGQISKTGKSDFELIEVIT